MILAGIEPGPELSALTIRSRRYPKVRLGLLDVHLKTISARNKKDLKFFDQKQFGIQRLSVYIDSINIDSTYMDNLIFSDSTFLEQILENLFWRNLHYIVL